MNPSSRVQDPPATSSWFAIHKPIPEVRLRLFCFPYAGGSALIYRNWHDKLPAGIEVVPIQLPGRGHRLCEPLFTAMNPLANTLVEVLVPWFDKPFAFFGHSMGAVIAFELARLLRRKNYAKPVHLFVSGHRAPQLPDPKSPCYNLPEPEFLDHLKSLEGTPVEVINNAELMALMMPVLRADFELVETYTYSPEPPLDISFSCFGGVDDHEADGENLEAWREQTNASYTRECFPGNHFFLNTHQRLLLGTLARHLNKLLGSLP